MHEGSRDLLQVYTKWFVEANSACFWFSYNMLTEIEERIQICEMHENGVMQCSYTSNGVLGMEF